MKKRYPDYVRAPNCNCKICGAKVYRRPSIIAKYNVFCSIKCSTEHKKRPRICAVCDKKYPARRNGKTCSRACSNKSRTGIKYNLDTPIINKNKSKSTLLREKILIERDAKCERCSFNNVEILQVHHIVERCNGGGDELSNLELLCPNCHCLHHFTTKTAMVD